MIQYLQYGLPLIFIALGLVIKFSKNPRWDSSRKMANILIILGILTLLGRIFLDYSKSKINLPKLKFVVNYFVWVE